MDQAAALAPRLTELDGRHDFDFVFGKWRTANRKRLRPLVEGDTEWIEFDGTIEARPILFGLGNVDTMAVPDFPGRGAFEGLTLRLFEPNTGLWRIWWASTVSGGLLDPPVVGRFVEGHGTFECDDVIEGRQVRVRFAWTVISSTAALWEQSFSFDAGRTFDLNWVAQLTREA
jgi:hypothetical protein